MAEFDIEIVDVNLPPVFEIVDQVRTHLCDLRCGLGLGFAVWGLGVRITTPRITLENRKEFDIGIVDVNLPPVFAIVDQVPSPNVDASMLTKLNVDTSTFDAEQRKGSRKHNGLFVNGLFGCWKQVTAAWISGARSLPFTTRIAAEGAGNTYNIYLSIHICIYI